MKTFRFVCSALALMVLMPSAQAQDTCRTGYLAPDVEIGALTLDLDAVATSLGFTPQRQIEAAKDFMAKDLTMAKLDDEADNRKEILDALELDLLFWIETKSRDSGETNLRVAAVHRDGAIRSHFDRFTDAEKDWDSGSMIDFVRNNHKECEQNLNPTPEPEPKPTPSAEQTHEAPVREYRQEAQYGPEEASAETTQTSTTIEDDSDDPSELVPFTLVLSDGVNGGIGFGISGYSLWDVVGLKYTGLDLIFFDDITLLSWNAGLVLIGGKSDEMALWWELTFGFEDVTYGDGNSEFFFEGASAVHFVYEWIDIGFEWHARKETFHVKLGLAFGYL